LPRQIVQDARGLSAKARLQVKVQLHHPQLFATRTAEAMRHHVGDSDGVGDFPWAQSCDAQRLEPFGHRALARIHLSDVGVHTVGEGAQNELLFGAQLGELLPPFRFGVTEGAALFVLLQRLFAHQLRQFALCRASVKFHLRQTVLGLRVTAGVKEAVKAGRKNVGDAVAVAGDLHDRVAHFQPFRLRRHRPDRCEQNRYQTPKTHHRFCLLSVSDAPTDFSARLWGGRR
jgi:hypothetical protein